MERKLSKSEFMAMYLRDRRAKYRRMKMRENDIQDYVVNSVMRKTRYGTGR